MHAVCCVSVDVGEDSLFEFVTFCVCGSFFSFFGPKSEVHIII